jgi:3-oxosteroid 1-dehydrogenase
VIKNLPKNWDIETDVVAVGSGGGGLTAAITAHEFGARALVLERSDKLGGVTAFSMGELWIPGNHFAAAQGVEDSPESGYRYIRRLSMGYGDDRMIFNQAVHGPVALKFFADRIGLKMINIRHLPDYYYPHIEHSKPEGRYLEVEPFPAATLGEWQHKVRVSPHVPYAMVHADIFDNGGLANMLNWDYSVMGERMAKDERCAGPGLAAWYVKGALDRKIPIHTGTSVVELFGDGERITGLRAIKDGKDVVVKANRGVVIAVSSYERNREFAKTLSHQIDPVSMVMPAIDGAHLRLAGQAGARIARVPDPSMLGIQVPGEEQEDGVPLWRGALPFMGLPHTIVVNQKGRRFSNEAFYRSVYYGLEVIDATTQTHPNYPCWLVLDQQARDKYPLGSVMPGQTLPDGLGVSADSLEALAQKTGIAAQGLAETVQRFNAYSASGKDEEFDRGSFLWGRLMVGDAKQKPNPNLGALSKPPYYAIPLHRMGGGGITSTGIRADEHCRAVDWNDRPIAGLYVAGNSVARMDNGAIMQSGLTNARGMTHGYLAGRHAAGRPSDLLEKELARLGGKPPQ